MSALQIGETFSTRHQNEFVNSSKTKRVHALHSYRRRIHQKFDYIQIYPSSIKHSCLHLCNVPILWKNDKKSKLVTDNVCLQIIKTEFV